MPFCFSGHVGCTSLVKTFSHEEKEAEHEPSSRHDLLSTPAAADSSGTEVSRRKDAVRPSVGSHHPGLQIRDAKSRVFHSVERIARTFHDLVPKPLAQGTNLASLPSIFKTNLLSQARSKSWLNHLFISH